MEQYTHIIETESANKVVSIKISFKAENCKGKLNVTDVMLQSGSMGIQWNAHPSEISWVVNEDE